MQKIAFFMGISLCLESNLELVWHDVFNEMFISVLAMWTIEFKFSTLPYNK